MVATLLYLPFGKFFHIFQRPAQLSVAIYKRSNAAMPPAKCRVCKEGFAGAMHVQDLKSVLSEVGLDWQMDGPAGHYSEVCPRCRRRLIGFSHGRVMARSRVANSTGENASQHERNADKDSASLVTYPGVLVN